MEKIILSEVCIGCNQFYNLLIFKLNIEMFMQHTSPSDL